MNSAGGGSRVGRVQREDNGRRKGEEGERSGGEPEGARRVSHPPVNFRDEARGPDAPDARSGTLDHILARSRSWAEATGGKFCGTKTS